MTEGTNHSKEKLLQINSVILPGDQGNELVDVVTKDGEIRHLGADKARSD